MTAAEKYALEKIGLKISAKTATDKEIAHYMQYVANLESILSMFLSRVQHALSVVWEMDQSKYLKIFKRGEDEVEENNPLSM